MKCEGELLCFSGAITDSYGSGVSCHFCLVNNGVSQHCVVFNNTSSFAFGVNDVHTVLKELHIGDIYVVSGREELGCCVVEKIERKTTQKLLF